VTTPVYLSLLHYPITSREGKLIATAVTNLDIHDIARSSRTYGIKRYFIVTPVEAQHRVVSRILRHWKSDSAKEYHPDRATALRRVELALDFEAVRKQVFEECGEEPEVILTDAQIRSETQKALVSYADLRKELETGTRTRPVIIVFGTGWGVAPLFFPTVHRILAPVYGHKEDAEGEYNHLSVRAAAAIILDRLFGN
jgi:hypothetical protein